MGKVHKAEHAVSQTIEIKNNCVSKGVTPGLLYSESTAYSVYHLTLCHNHLITLFIPEMNGHVSMLGSFLALAFLMYASLYKKKRCKPSNANLHHVRQLTFDVKNE